MNDKLKEIQKVIVSAVDPEKIYLFGSRSNGNFKDKSDYDILVVKKTNVPKYKLLVKIYKSFKIRDFSLDILMFTPEEIEEWRSVSSSFIHHVLKTGKLVYER
ncbi:MAG: nucleotidyltransferase domain-containing protein [Ignavibacteria bacterium]|nr:nucleotidyltransferase domain-containing protein [Ignavibacteria bacterium]